MQPGSGLLSPDEPQRAKQQRQSSPEHSNVLVPTVPVRRVLKVVRFPSLSTASTRKVSVLFGLAWALAERYRLFALQRAEVERAETLSKLPGAVMALAEMR